MVEYAKLKEKQHLASAFNQWKQQKRKKDAKKHCIQNRMKKVMIHPVIHKDENLCQKFLFI